MYKCPGGKNRIAKKFIIPKILSHRRWFDGTYFGGSTTIMKPKSDVEVAVDLNPLIIRLNQSIQNHPHEIRDEIKRIPYTETSFIWAEDWQSEHDDITFAVKYLTRNRLSRDGMMKNYVNSLRERGGMPENQNVFRKLPDNLIKYYERIKNIRFIHGDVVSLLDWVGQDEDNCIFIDLPYLMGERRSANLYMVEAAEPVHEAMLDAALKCRAQCLIIHYSHPLYESKLSHWNRWECNVKINMGIKDNKRKATEILWRNR